MRHPDEKLGNRAFTTKYINILREPYEIPTAKDEQGVQGDDELGESLGSRDTEEMQEDLDGEEKDSNFYAEGEAGDLYDDEEKEGEVVGKGKEKGRSEDNNVSDDEITGEMEDE